MKALSRAVASGFARVAVGGSACVSRVASGPLAAYPEGAVHPDPDMMASLVAPLAGAVSGTTIVSFPPEQALALIDAWSEVAVSGADALARYRRGTRALAEAAAGALGLRVGESDALEEDALVSTLLATHAPADTAVLSAAIDVDLGGMPCQGVFLLLVDAKALTALVG